MIWALLNEESWRTKVSHGRAQGDLKHAYDQVQHWMVELAQLRLGVPMAHVEHDIVARLTQGKLTAVITPFDLSEWFRRGSGLPQGAPESCPLFDAVMDMLADMQDAMCREQGAFMPDQCVLWMQTSHRLYPSD